MRLAARRQPAYALATILVLLGVAMLSSAALVSSSVLESKISRSQLTGTVALSTAEAGLADALWKSLNDTAIRSDLAAGLIGTSSYALADVPAAGQSVSVALQNSVPGYLQVTSTGTAVSGNLTATKVVQAQLFQAATALPSNAYAIQSGGSLTITSPASAMTLSGGWLYAAGPVQISLGASVTANFGTNRIQTVGTAYGRSGTGTLTSGTVQTGVVRQGVPGPDYRLYVGAGCSASYRVSVASELAALKTALTSSAGLSGPITCVVGDFDVGAWANGQTLKASGMLVVHGNLTVTSRTATWAIADPGTGKAGLFINGSVLLRGGGTIDGLVTAVGNVDFRPTQSFTVNGALISGGNLSITQAAALSVAYSAARVTASLPSGGTPYTGVIREIELTP